MIGITIVSVGTVLPGDNREHNRGPGEATGHRHRQPHGTLIFNTLVVAGTAAAISGVTFALFDVYFGLAMIFGLLVAVLLALRYRGRYQPHRGSALLAVYAVFTLVIVALG